MNREALSDQQGRCIYALSDPRDRLIRSTGMSGKGQVRFKQLLPRKRGTLSRRIQELASLNLQPNLSILETVENERRARECEKYRIDYSPDRKHSLEHMQSNMLAWYDRWLTSDEQPSIAGRYAHDPEERARHLDELTIQEGHTTYGSEAWEGILQTVQATGGEMERFLACSCRSSEAEIARLTFRVLGKLPGDESEVLE
jgi:hypothetical protein